VAASHIIVIASHSLPPTTGSIEFKVRDLLGKDGLGGPHSTALEHTSNVKRSRELRTLGSTVNTTVRVLEDATNRLLLFCLSSLSCLLTPHV
jgi:hypothetical protein